VVEPGAVGVEHGGALVADERLAEAERVEDAAGRLRHPAGDDDHAQPLLVGAAEGRDRPRPHRVQLPDQGAVEIARDDLDVRREVGRKLERAKTRGAQ